MRLDFGDVYRAHVTPIWRYVRSRVPADADAEDVTSEVFARAMRTWPSFDPARGSVGGWLTGIARFTVADWWRRHGRELPSAELATHDAADPDVDVEADVEGELLRRDGADTIRRHLGLLTPREREAVALRFAAELTSAEIGAAMSISAPAARMLVHRAVEKLRTVVTDDRA